MMKQENVNVGAQTKRPRKRLIVLGLDGVPWQAVNESRRAGRFCAFYGPSRVISPFPTITNIGMHSLLGTPKSRGYESLYFDRGCGRVCGGSIKYLGFRKRKDEKHGYNSLFDYREPTRFEYLVYVVPERIFLADLTRFLSAFKYSTAEVFYAFLKSTDGLIHIGGREKLMTALSQLDAELSQLYEDNSGELEIVLYSDHGNDFNSFKRVPLKSRLESNGFAISSRISGKRSVIIPGFGLVSYAPIYTQRQNCREIAESLASVPGVDFTVFRSTGEASVTSGGATELIGPKGHARIHRDEKTCAFRYEPIKNDPLCLAPIARKLESKGLIDSRGYADDGVWLNATSDHRYPDALHNIWLSVRDHVESPADLLASFEEGYCYGSATFNRIVSLAATHGNALRSTSYAFLMSTHRETPAFMRADQARFWLRGQTGNALLDG